MARRKRRGAPPAPDSGLEPGELVPLAEGPVGSVLAGIDHVTGEAFALKVYPGKLDRTVRVELEAELTRLWPLRARTPLLVADRVQHHDGKCAVRMELAAQSLPELISSFGPLSVPDALALGESIATALAAAHRAGVVHGGVTPGNVLFRPSGEAVLSDFGLALRNAFPQDSARDVSYLAPETVRDGTADERSDVYGIGAILYLALSARPPHAGQLGESTGERLLRVLDATPPPLTRTDLPHGLPVLLSALLAKDPHARPIDAAEVAARLGAMGSVGAPATTGTTGTPDAQTPLRGHGDAPAFDDFATPLNHPAGPPAPPRPAVPPAPAQRPAAVERPAPVERPAAVERPAPAAPAPDGRPAAVEPPRGRPAGQEPARQAPPQRPAEASPWARPSGYFATTAAQPAQQEPPARPEPPKPEPPRPERPVEQAPPVRAAEQERDDLSLDTETAKVQRQEERVDTVRVKPSVAADLSDPDRTQAIPGTHMTQSTVHLPRDVVRAHDGGRMPSRGITSAPTGQQVLVFRAAKPQRRVTPGMIALAAAGALCIGVLVAMIMLLNRPDELSMPPSQVDVGAASSSEEDKVERVELTLAKPVDRGEYVELKWESSVPLEYAVIVAVKGEKARAVLTNETSLRIEIDPKREYCFQVQGSDSNRVTYQSDPRPIRGASCAQ